MLQSKATSLASELEACTQRTEAKCTGIRKEVSKAMAEQRQQLLTQSETIMKKMEAVSAKVCICVATCKSQQRKVLPVSTCRLLACLPAFVSAVVSACHIGALLFEVIGRPKSCQGSWPLSARASMLHPFLCDCVSSLYTSTKSLLCRVTGRLRNCQGWWLLSAGVSTLQLSA